MMKKTLIILVLTLMMVFALSAETTKKMTMAVWQNSTNSFISNEYVNYSIAEEDIKHAFENGQVIAWYVDNTVTYKDNCRIVIQLNSNFVAWYGMDEEEYTHLLLVNAYGD